MAGGFGGRDGTSIDCDRCEGVETLVGDCVMVCVCVWACMCVYV